MASSTIIVRHLPPQISCEQKEEFLKFFGAKHIKILTSKANNRCIAYARFDSQDLAEAVIQRLHQKVMLGQRLTVELSPNDLDVNLMKCPKPVPVSECDTDEVKKIHDEYLKKLNSWSRSLDLSQPPPHHLRYSYPNPNPHILSNIANALAANRKFYYQVLHLMNRMNLPAPFEPAKVCDLKKLMNTQTADKCTTTYETDPELSESEMESECESDHVEHVKPKMSSLKRKLYKSMKPKHLKTVNKTVIPKKPKVELTKVFDTVECEAPKKIEVKVSAELRPAEGPTAETEGGFGVIYSIKNVAKEDNNKECESDDDLTGESISKEELAMNRLSEKDLKDISIFKNYFPGAPSCRLYIKNLAKTVVDNDLKYIYKRFIEPEDLKPGTMFDVRLMQEGRMKGQAFVTLPSVENAQQALKETNGYILKDKPMVVQFARSATAK